MQIQYCTLTATYENSKSGNIFKGKSQFQSTFVYCRYFVFKIYKCREMIYSILFGFCIIVQSDNDDSLFIQLIIYVFQLIQNPDVLLVIFVIWKVSDSFWWNLSDSYRCHWTCFAELHRISNCCKYNMDVTQLSIIVLAAEKHNYDTVFYCFINIFDERYQCIYYLFLLCIKTNPNFTHEKIISLLGLNSLSEMTYRIAQPDIPLCLLVSPWFHLRYQGFHCGASGAPTN